jgi:hypothetical protein
MEWFVSKGADVYLPLGHSPDADFIAELDGRLLRVQVKTSTRFLRDRWSGLVKRLDRSTYDRLFVVVGDGRRWCLPSEAVEAGSQLHLGGSKYACFEVEPGRPLRSA